MCLPRRYVLALLLWAAPAAGGATVTTNPDGTSTVSPPSPESGPSPARPSLPPSSTVLAWVSYFADVRHMRFVLSDLESLDRETIAIARDPATGEDAAWEGFLSALEVHHYALIGGGNTVRLVKVGSPHVGAIRADPNATDDYLTQLIHLEHTRVDDMLKRIQPMVGPNARILAYPPTDTLIVTDTAANVREVYARVRALDAAPSGPDE